MEANAREEVLSSPVIALYLALGLTALTVACLAWNAVTSRQQISDVYRRDLRIEELRGNIAYLDEARTASARFSALTGDPDWEPRYRQFVPELKKANQEARGLARSALAADIIERTDAANDALLFMEGRALEYAREQRFFEARTILFGERYLRQKAAYSAGIEELDRTLKRSVEESLDAAVRRVEIILIVCAITLPLIIVCWFLALRATNRWKTALIGNHQRLLRQSAELSQLNADLDRKVVEHARLQEIAEQASRIKSEFLANMSHEIRTPMNGVIGMTELLLDTKLSPVQLDYAETIRDSAAALLTVINDILDFSKVEAGQLKLELVDMDLRDTVYDVARLLAIQAHAKGLEISAHIDPSLPELVKGDPGRVRQVLMNLCGNAVKFTAHGEVAINVEVASMDAQGGLVRCEIRDTGIGIPVERLSELFRPFSQLDGSATRKYGGTGLGLSIVRRLVELMGGETGVESQEGVGSTFWFTVRFGAASTAQVSLRTTPAELKNQRILVVDDNATNRKVLEAQLRLCGAESSCVASAYEALPLMIRAAEGENPFAVALVDHQMPDCDGAELGRRIVGNDRLKSTRLVLLTSSGQQGDGHRFSELGFAGYLLKPVSQRDLVDCLMLVLSAKAEEWHAQTQPIVTRHELSAMRVQNQRWVLVTDDNAVNQKVACRLLQNLGYRTDVANDGKEAVAAWETGKYELILMDCQMPVLDGYEATREIRQRELDGKRIPIVALTADAMKDVDMKCKAAGMDDYLSKPIAREQLAACLERYLGGTQVKN